MCKYNVSTRMKLVYRMALIFRGSKFLCELLFDVENLISRIRGKTPRPQNGCGVLYCTCVKSADSTSYTKDHFVGALYSATLSSPLRRSQSSFLDTYLPGRFAGSSWQLQYWQISHMSYRWYHKRSTVPIGRTLHVDLEAYTSTSYCPSC